MKPTVISNPNSSASSGSSNLTGGNGFTIPINHEYRGQTTNQHQQQPHFNAQAQNFNSDPHASSYGSPSSLGRSQRHQPYSQHQQESPSHFQDYEPDAGMDMFPRTRLGRMTHDPFADFGGTTRKRNSLHDPQFHTDGFSRYFDDAADFGFPQFNSLGRRRINPHNDDDFFNRLPSEFRQYIPDSFAQRRSGMAGSPSSVPTKIHTEQSAQQQPQPNFYDTMPPSFSQRKVCDAAIQTEDPSGRSEVDHLVNADNLCQHGLRNTMDMGVKSPSENENQSPRSSSAPPTEQQKQQLPNYDELQQIPIDCPNQSISPPQKQHQFATQTSPHLQSEAQREHSPQFQKSFYASQHAHPQKNHESAAPQTPGGSYIRTIPIFVEGRTEPIINNKEIPNQNVSPGNARACTPPKQHTHRPTPLNTQKQSKPERSNTPPQTPHTVDTINKIQDIQRDVLALMSRVENFTGTRADKEYVYLDEMLTRNLLKLDNIDTNGKESIRLARKEAIKCIQASINVLEAKAEENKKATQHTQEANEPLVGEAPVQKAEAQKSASKQSLKESLLPTASEQMDETADNNISEPIPLPPPESEKYNVVKIEDCPEDDVAAASNNEEFNFKTDDTQENLFKTK